MIEIDKIQQIQELIELRKSLLKSRSDFEHETKNRRELYVYQNAGSHYINNEGRSVMGPFTNTNIAEKVLLELTNYVNYQNSQYKQRLDLEVEKVDKQITSLLR